VRNNVLLIAALALSGCASLVLETLWFDWLALHWGRTAEASAAVLACFMLGLGLGQWLMLKRQSLPLSSAKLWALCELLVGLFALAANSRFANSSDVVSWTALLWILAPTLFMGMTLPLAVACLRQQTLSTGIGLAYAANTSGAALGAVATVWWLIPQLGLSHTGLVAVFGQCLAALLVFIFASSRSTKTVPSDNPTGNQQNSGTPWQPLLAVAASGLFVLGMEVIWFRALLLTHRSTSENFAVMLAVVLVGLAIGSACASAYMRKRPSLATSQALVALLVIQSLVTVIGLILWQPGASGSLLLHAAVLIALPCICSGALMIIATRALQQATNQRSASAQLILASTLGSSIGAPLVALYLLPTIGVAHALQCLLLITALAALLNQTKLAAAGFVAVGIIAFALPEQWQQKQSRAAQLYVQLDQAEIIAQADGKYQSVQLLESRFLEQPLSHRLVTDSYSMTSTAADSERYMRLFAWLPQAMRSDLNDVLLISYGVGTTAETLLATANTQSLTIADPSATILATSRLIQRPAQPLDDPRVRLRLEDGRKVLQQNPEQFDLITGEPPPPRLAGMHALYSQEYFQLMQQALKPQGWASYWLPVDQLTVASSKAIIQAFCKAFADCSLWAGSHYNWILLGSKQGQVASDAITTLFNDSASTQQLKTAGFENSVQLASSFIAGPETLQQWIGTQPAVSDNWPQRIESRWPGESDIKTYAQWMDGVDTETRFEESYWATQWPLNDDHLQIAWAIQPLLNGQFRPNETQRLQVVSQLLTITDWEAPVLWALGTDHKRVAIAEAATNGATRNRSATNNTAPNQTAELHQAVGLLARRDPAAISQLQKLAEHFPLAADLAAIATQR
jgi:spermidine synthase